MPLLKSIGRAGSAKVFSNKNSSQGQMAAQPTWQAWQLTTMALLQPLHGGTSSLTLMDSPSRVGSTRSDADVARVQVCFGPPSGMRNATVENIFALPTEKPAAGIKGQAGLMARAYDN